MCAIVGACGSKVASEPVAVRMRDSMAHRGPDAAGLYVAPEDSVVLGHCRLSIIDLSSGARQPMSTADGRWTIVFNGEIYNYLELRRELGSRACFRTDSDTEVLLEGYRAWGEAVLEKLRGPFAFAVWDRDERELFLARDRVGKRPLYYLWDGATFAFASELKALRTLPGFDAELDRAATDCFLSLGYIPAPFTIYRHVHKLQAGHRLKLKGRQVSLQRYWLPEHSATRPAATLAARVRECRALLADAVKLRLRADVPVGLFLSGGVDSSIIAYEAVAQGGQPEAVTVRFDGDETDLPYAAEVAAGLKLTHHVVDVAAPTDEELAAIVRHYDEPFADSSNVPSYLMARASRGLFKVALNGDGGDEAFGGYRHYERVALKQAAKSIACALSLRDGRSTNPWHVYLQSKAVFRRRMRRELLELGDGEPDAFSAWIDSEPFLNGVKPAGALKRAMWADRHIYLPNDLMYKMDMALGAFGMEGRSPLLDHLLLEWSQGLSPAELVAGAAKKVLLRHAYEGAVPAAIFRRDKKGFGAPVVLWLRGPLRDLAVSLLPSSSFSARPQRELLAAFFDRGEHGAAAQVWALLVFALWAEGLKAGS